MTFYRIYQVGWAFLTILRAAIVIHWLLTLFNMRSAVTDWIGGFIAPFVTPFRRLSVWLMRRTNVPLDFTYVFALIGLSIVARLWYMLYVLIR